MPLSPFLLLLALLALAPAAPTTSTLPFLLPTRSPPTPPTFTLPITTIRLASRPLPASGLTADPCFPSSALPPCVAPRRCLSIFRGSVGDPCQVEHHCACYPPTFPACASTADCHPGERCSHVFYLPHPSCFSAAVEASGQWVVEVSPEPNASSDADGEDPLPSEEDPHSSPEEASPSDPLGDVPLEGGTPGLTLAPCQTDADCLGMRTCRYMGMLTDFSECDGRDYCMCLPPKPPYCFGTQFCEPGEACFEAPLTLPWAMCASASAVRQHAGMREVNKPTKGYTLDGCRRLGDCRGERVCTAFNGGPNKSTVCDGTVACVCLPGDIPGCSSSTECEDGELCAITPIADASLCVSRDAAVSFNRIKEVSGTASPTPKPKLPSPTPLEGANVENTESPGASPEPLIAPGSCVDASVLAHLDSADLVFERHAWAEVLCDENRSCATEGHVVEFAGRVVMMRTYCRIVGCVQRRMYVNSPRFKRGLRVASKTDGLLFTAFAAKYATRAEEIALGVAVRLGL